MPTEEISRVVNVQFDRVDDVPGSTGYWAGKVITAASASFNDPTTLEPGDYPPVWWGDLVAHYENVPAASAFKLYVWGELGWQLLINRPINGDGAFALSEEKPSGLDDFTFHAMMRDSILYDPYKLPLALVDGNDQEVAGSVWLTGSFTENATIGTEDAEVSAYTFTTEVGDEVSSWTAPAEFVSHDGSEGALFTGRKLLDFNAPDPYEPASDWPRPTYTLAVYAYLPPEISALPGGERRRFSPS